jgi:trehalose-6-phosphate synthase
VTVNPFDVGQTADALYTALTSPLATRQATGDSIRQVVRANDIGRWISLQIRDLRDLLTPPVSTE